MVYLALTTELEDLRLLLPLPAKTLNRCKSYLTITNGLVQVVADNFDVHIYSQSGLKQTHLLAMLLAQTKHEENNGRG